MCYPPPLSPMTPPPPLMQQISPMYMSPPSPFSPKSIGPSTYTRRLVFNCQLPVLSAPISALIFQSWYTFSTPVLSPPFFHLLSSHQPNNALSTLLSLSLSVLLPPVSLPPSLSLPHIVFYPFLPFLPPPLPNLLSTPPSSLHPPPSTLHPLPFSALQTKVCMNSMIH